MTQALEDPAFVQFVGDLEASLTNGLQKEKLAVKI
jgi:hypothetical protein